MKCKTKNDVANALAYPNWRFVLLAVFLLGIILLGSEESPQPEADLQEYGFQLSNRPQVPSATVPQTRLSSYREAGQALHSGADPLSSAVADMIQNPSRQTVQFNLKLLQAGLEKLTSSAGYTSTFYKQERLGSCSNREEVMEVKLRHQPFSVYLKWLLHAPDQELLYVEGKNDNRMFVRQTGWKGRLVPVLNLDPSGTLAMMESRYSIADFGMLALAEKLIGDRQQDLSQGGMGYHSEYYEDEICNGYACYRFIHEYESPQYSQLYRKSDLYIDKEWSLPIHIENYTWPEENSYGSMEDIDDATLIECYSYSDITLDTQLVDIDFDRANENYHFAR